MKDKKITVERGISEHIIKALEDKGHDISYEDNANFFGHGQIILRDEDGILRGGTEPRCDSAVVAW